VQQNYRRCSGVGGVFLSVAYGGHLHFVFSACDVTI